MPYRKILLALLTLVALKCAPVLAQSESPELASQAAESAALERESAERLAARAAVERQEAELQALRTELERARRELEQAARNVAVSVVRSPDQDSYVRTVDVDVVGNTAPASARDAPVVRRVTAPVPRASVMTLIGEDFSPPATDGSRLQILRTLNLADSTWGAMELVPMTAELGRYFGTDEGLLVVRGPADDAIDIQDGDVILAIGARQPNSPGHAIRILSSFERGEMIEFTLMRDGLQRTVAYRMPESPEEGAVEFELEQSPR